jgi:hypothetical protein
MCCQKKIPESAGHRSIGRWRAIFPFVIAKPTDPAPDRIAHVVYLDAFVPENG